MKAQNKSAHSALDLKITNCFSAISSIALLMCSGVCDRSLRPLACRFFPLRPTARGRVVMDRRGFFVCPLTESGMGGLNGDFVAAAREAAAVLCENETQRAFLEALGASIRRVLSQSSL